MVEIVQNASLDSINIMDTNMPSIVSQVNAKTRYQTNTSPSNTNKFNIEKQNAQEAKVAERMFRVLFDIKSDPKAKRPPQTEIG